MTVQGTGPARGAAHRPRASTRRAIPLRDITLPHTCPRPVRMHVLSRAPYFRGLDEADLDRIDARMRTTSWQAGDTIYRAGEPAGGLYVAAEGRVRISQGTAAGTETVTDFMVPGELFGAMSTLGEPVHRQTATALVPSCTLRIDQDDFRQVLAEFPAVSLRVLDDLASRLARAHSDIGGQSSDTVAQRTATALLRLADKLGEFRRDGRVMLEVPLSRADLAGLARSTPESVSRVMSTWKRQGIVDSGRRWTALLDLERLRAEAGSDG